VADLPADLAAPVVIVLHIGAHRSQLAELLDSRTSLKVEWASNGAPLVGGVVYVAPSDHHVVVEGAALRITQGPRENLSRPAIDPLFRSAAESFGPEAIGVILTGRLNDGTFGLHEIKRHGGLAIVQDPATAEQPSMPGSALRHVAVDHVVPLDGIGRLLGSLVAVKGSSEPPRKSKPMNVESHDFETPVAQVCPDCGGAMKRVEAAGLIGFRCHTGHRMTGEVLASTQLAQVERHVEAVIRLLHEGTALAKEFETTATATNDDAGAASWRRSGERLSESLVHVLALSEQLPRPDELEL
jgi:two-component system, chemotaxis family, protein-glutamate methylesterase/glutaminase